MELSENIMEGNFMEMTPIEILLVFLRRFKSDKDVQARFLQQYISNYGPIPDEYGDKVRDLLNADA